MGNFSVDGRSFSGSSLKIIGNQVYVDGVLQEGSLTGVVKVIVEGELASLQTDASVECGNVRGPVNAGVAVRCGDVTGDVSAGTSVTAKNVTGNVTARTAVTCDDVGGSVTASFVKKR